MRKFILVFLLIIANEGVNAQNWRTVSSLDTAYFMAGVHAGSRKSAGVVTMDTGMIRAISIRGVQVSGVDTIFLLQRAWRDTTAGLGVEESNCIDSIAASWLGPYFIRRPDGTEYFFNSRMDTITMRTQAAQGDSWMIAHDSADTWFKGTVVQSGLMMVDGQSDSFKTINIQAYNAGTPVPHWYNAMVLQLTKNYGWTKTLDLYRFPNRKTEWDHGGAGVDSTQHSRLPASVSKVDLLQPEISWRYAPGNEWIREYKSGAEPSDVNHRSITHDSVISNMSLSPGVLAVTLRTVQFTHKLVPGPGGQGVYADSTFTTIHTDTITTGSASQTYLSTLTLGPGAYDAMDLRLFADSFCSDRYFVRRRSLRRSGITGGTPIGCLRVLPWVSGFEVSTQDYLTGFGPTNSFFFEGQVSSGFYNEETYTYLDLGGCQQGTKMDVAKLDLLAMSKAPGFQVYPNPANNLVSITTNLPSQSWQLTLRNISGQIIFQQKHSGQQLNIATADIPSGLYFLEVSGRETRQTFKVLIQH